MQGHSPEYQLTVFPKSHQTHRPISSLLDTPLHSREKKSSSMHQNTDSSFHIQETLKANHQTPPTRRNLHNKKKQQITGIQKGHSKHSNINKMKRQRNTQQVREHGKCPPSQTKEEEIGNPPEKEFRIMIIKMIQNLENKMELQISSLETGLRRCKKCLTGT